MKDKSTSNTGSTIPKAKRFGIVSYHVGELESREDLPATVSFKYFRTKSGLPPEVEKRREAERNKK